MEIPDLITQRLGDEELESAVNLGDEDLICFTPSRTLLHRGEGLLGDESIEAFEHDVERLEVSEGRRKTTFTLTYVDSEEGFTVANDRTEPVLERLLAGILDTADVIDSGESIEGVFWFGELTVIITDTRIIKHVGPYFWGRDNDPWDGDSEEISYADMTALNVEEDSISSNIVISVPGRQERFEVPHREAEQVKLTLSNALFEFYEVNSISELNETLAETPPSPLEESEKSVSKGDESTTKLRDEPELSFDNVPKVEEFPSPPRQSLTYEDIIIGKMLGSGGQAIVYEATLRTANSPTRVALKEPAKTNHTLTREAVESFLERAQTWLTVDSRERNKPRWEPYEYILGVIDIGETRPWIALEYADGGSLANRLDDNSTIPIDEAVWIAHCMCSALEVAHDYGVAHLDMKPGNVLFVGSETANWTVPKLADWGLARKLAENTGSMEALSANYAAPEQFDANEFGDPDTITDVYQVGAVLYAMLTGEPPATGGRLAVMKSVLDEEPPPPPSTHCSDIPASLNDIVLKALATKKRNRYESVRYLRDDLREISGDVVDIK